MFWDKYFNYEQIFDNYNHTIQFNNKHPELERQLSKPLILLDGFHNDVFDKYRMVSAYVKIDSFLYVLKYNILKILLEKNLIDPNELNENNLLPIIIFPVNIIDYPNLVYHRHNGEIINQYRLDWCPGYYAFIFNEIILFKIIKTLSNYKFEIAEICSNEFQKLTNSLKD